MSQFKLRLRQYALAVIIAFAMAGSAKTFVLVMAVEIFIIEMPVLYRYDNTIHNRGRAGRLDDPGRSQ